MRPRTRQANQPSRAIVPVRPPTSARAATPDQSPSPAEPPERPGEERGGQHEQEAHEPAESPLALGRVDLDVDRVRRAAAETGVRAGREHDVRGDVRRVAHVAGEEVVDARRHLTLDQHGEPGDERDRARCDAVERHPDEVGQGEEQSEADGQARPAEVVGDDEADRMTTRLGLARRRHARILRMRARREQVSD